jgi:uncharacterized membrane protein
MNGGLRETEDHAMQTLIGNLLRAGVILSASVVLLGSCVYLFHHGMEKTHYDVFLQAPAEMRDAGGIVKNTFAGPWHGRGLIQLGLLLLIATPVARVALAMAAFARIRDKLYVAVTAVVFFILIFSLLHR